MFDEKRGMNGMKKSGIIVALMIMILAAALAGCVQPEQKPVIKIGAILPLTGDAASYGINAQNGIILESEEVNAQGGINGQNLSIIFEDSAAQPAQAVTAAQKLIGVDNVVAIIGDVASSPTLAIAPIANQNQIIVVSPAASSPNLSSAGPYFYRVWPSDTFEADCMADYINRTGINSMSLLYVNNDYGSAMAQEVKKSVGNSSIIISEENFNQGTTDVRAQFTKIKAANPQYLYLISYTQDTITILKQYKELGLTSKLLSTSTFEDPLILQQVGDVAEGTVYTFPIPPSATDPVVSAFKANYTARFGTAPGLLSDYGYDSLLVIVESMKLSNDTSKVGVYNGIHMIKNLHGATGLINFNGGDVIKPSGMKTVKGGQFVWLEQ